MANRGRPRVINPKARELMIGLVGMGCSRRRAARHAGVSRSVLYPALFQQERENCWTTPGPNCPSSPTNQPAIAENAAFDEGAGI